MNVIMNDLLKNNKKIPDVDLDDKFQVDEVLDSSN